MKTSKILFMGFTAAILTVSLRGSASACSWGGTYDDGSDYYVDSDNNEYPDDDSCQNHNAPVSFDGVNTNTSPTTSNIGVNSAGNTTVTVTAQADPVSYNSAALPAMPLVGTFVQDVDLLGVVNSAPIGSSVADVAGQVLKNAAANKIYPVDVPYGPGSTVRSILSAIGIELINTASSFVVAINPCLNGRQALTGIVCGPNANN